MSPSTTTSTASKFIFEPKENDSKANLFSSGCKSDGKVEADTKLCFLKTEEQEFNDDKTEANVKLSDSSDEFALKYAQKI